MKIAFVGDLVLQDLDKNPSSIFSELKYFLKKEDSKLILNLESPFIKADQNPIKNKITLYSVEKGITYISYLSPYLTNLSNNHINDYGNNSVKYTIDLLKNESIDFFGVGLKQEEFYLYKKDKIIFLAFTVRSADLTGSKLFTTEDFFGVKDIDLNLISDIRYTHPECSIIVNIHWGVEDIKYPEPEKIILGRQVIDAGADLLIGHHSHIIQPYEIYKNKYIFYSLGNFYFNDIFYSLQNKKYLKKALKHQKIGLMPLFSFNGQNINLDKIYKIYINNEGKLRVKNNKQKNSWLTLLPIKSYSIFHKIYIFIRLWMKRITKLILNPQYYLKKIF